MKNCTHCDEKSDTDEQYADHLATAHTHEELDRIDRRQVDTQTGNSALRRVTGRSGLSRRAALGTVGLAVVGAVGIGQAVSGPTLSSLTNANPTGIEDWDDLAKIGTDEAYPLDGEYVLETGLDEETDGYGDLVDTADGWDPINEFTGSFDGQDHTIADLVIDRDDRTGVGLFGTEMAGTVTGVVLRSVDVTGGDFTGSVVGEVIDGTVTECFVTGRVHGGDYTGGVFGECRNGTATDVATTADVTGEKWVGGLVGRQEATADEKSTIQRTYTLGEIEGDERVGGFVGRQESTGGDAEVLVEVGYTTARVADDSGDTIGILAGKQFSEGEDSISTIEAYVDVDTRTTDSPGDVKASDGGFASLISDGLETTEMQGETPTPNGDDRMSGFGFDFEDDWTPVITDKRINPRPLEDGYPILRRVNPQVQLEGQGTDFELVTDAIRISGEDVTITNTTVSGDD